MERSSSSRIAFITTSSAARASAGSSIAANMRIPIPRETVFRILMLLKIVRSPESEVQSQHATHGQTSDLALRTSTLLPNGGGKNRRPRRGLLLFLHFDLR